MYFTCSFLCLYPSATVSCEWRSSVSTIVNAVLAQSSELLSLKEKLYTFITALSKLTNQAGWTSSWSVPFPSQSKHWEQKRKIMKRRWISRNISYCLQGIVWNPALSLQEEIGGDYYLSSSWWIVNCLINTESNMCLTNNHLCLRRKRRIFIVVKKYTD